MKSETPLYFGLILIGTGSVWACFETKHDTVKKAIINLVERTKGIYNIRDGDAEITVSLFDASKHDDFGWDHRTTYGYNHDELDKDGRITKRYDLYEEGLHFGHYTITIPKMRSNQWTDSRKWLQSLDTAIHELNL